MTETLLANADLVLPDRVLRGAVLVRDGLIAAIDAGTAVPPGAVDCDGDLVIPGLIELHTDNLERHLQPRPGVDWPHAAAILAHDAELAGTGITTVFDALRVGSVLSRGKRRLWRICPRPGHRKSWPCTRRDALRISHLLHLRAEICSETLADELAEVRPRGRGRHRQPDGPHARPAPVPRCRAAAHLLQGKHGMTERGLRRPCRRAAGHLRPHRRGARGGRGRCRRAALGAMLASHDDTTRDQVADSAAHGVRLRRVSHHAGRRAGLPRRRHRGDDRRAQPDPRRLAFRQCRRRAIWPKRTASTSCPPTMCPPRC